jgi:NAD(P)-dependent dehydrogenase (short-subunit alcohol dehydrogenase family)
MSETDGIALVTGANKGIGREIARQLVLRGMTVLVGARDPKRGAEAELGLRAERKGDARAVRLDLTDADTIDSATDFVGREYGRLDVLVNNAGIAIDDGPPSQVSPERLRQTFETNLFGTVAVTQAMLPLLRRSDAGRIVNMSSGLGSLTLHRDPDWEHYSVKILAYNASKTALNAFTVHLAHELRDTPIKVNSADPGYVATDLNHHSGRRTVKQGAAIAVRLATLESNGPTGGFFDEEGAVPW